MRYLVVRGDDERQHWVVGRDECDQCMSYISDAADKGVMEAEVNFRPTSAVGH